MKFIMNKVEESNAKKFIEDKARPAAVRFQRKTTRNPDRHVVKAYWEEGFPYGETIRYSFSNSNGIGTAVTIQYEAGAFRLEENITDYSTW